MASPRLRSLAFTSVLTACFVDPGVSATTDATDTDADTTTSSTTKGSGTSTDPSTTTGSTDPTTTADPTSSSTTADPTSSSTTTTNPGTTAVDPICGDGHVDPGEECDDGNIDDTDTCTNTCTLSKVLRVFLSGELNGNIGGVEKADAKCQGEAMSAGLPGTYLAWISVDGRPAAQTIPDHSLGYVLPGPEATHIATGRAGFLSPTHKNPIDRLANGKQLPISPGCSQDGAGLVWTGSQPDGSIASPNCVDFTNGDPNIKGTAGNSGGYDLGWADNCQVTCNTSLRLYCLQIP